ncbi:hypothetical protein KSP39_PZI015764 [Platanthera zijinensis]|uniref:N-acetyltransferase domain-containing protein n=1 Tax=Platanthera zijinensis TaxID=2320716 RepID=A0AAP0G1P2_9ASPA
MQRENFDIPIHREMNSFKPGRLMRSRDEDTFRAHSGLIWQLSIYGVPGSTTGLRDCVRSIAASTKLLNHVMDLSAKQNISEIYLHVQTNNEDAISFYKKFGFEITETIENYYTNISPPDCYVVSKLVTQPAAKK